MSGTKSDWHSPRINGGWVLFPKRLSSTKSRPEGIIYHRECNDENIEMDRSIWLTLPIYEVKAPLDDGYGGKVLLFIKNEASPAREKSE